MSPTDISASARPVRWGLAAKLFAILLLLGAVAVLVTGGAGLHAGPERIIREVT